MITLDSGFVLPEAVRQEVLAKLQKLMDTFNRNKLSLSRPGMTDAIKTEIERTVDNRPDPKPNYVINASADVTKASSPLPNRTIKCHRRISLEEIEERRLKGLCLFCEESETPDHYLLHKNSGILLIDCDEDQSCDDEELVEMEVVTESNGIEVNKQRQFQVPVSKLEHGLQIHKVSTTVCEDSQYVAGCDDSFDHQKSLLQVSHVKARDELLTKSIDVTNNQAAHYLFDKMPLRVRSKMRRSKCPKCWRFKFKNRDLRGYNLSRVKLLPKNSLVITEFERKKKKLCVKTWMFKYKNVEECIKRLHNQLRYNFRLENERCCERESRKKCHSYVRVSELLQKSHGTVILGIKVSSPEEVVEDQIHDKLTSWWKVGIEGVMEFFLGIGMGKHQRERTEAKQNLKHWYGDSLLEFLKRIEAGSSMIMVLYNNTELINYLYHLEKSCFVSIIRIKNALIEARFVKTMEEYSKNHLASTLAYELFHYPRPPELCVAERMIEEDMNKDYQKQQGDLACYHVWHRWKARCCFVGVISTMWAWLFGEEGFDIGKEMTRGGSGLKGNQWLRRLKTVVKKR